VFSLCPQPQKSIYFSLNSLAHRDHLENLFLDLSSWATNYTMTYYDLNSQLMYALSNISYRLAYNNHLQEEQFLSSTSLRVKVGVVNVHIRIPYAVILANGEMFKSGIAFAQSYLDPTTFDKGFRIDTRAIEWKTLNVSQLNFNALWVL
jgi:hypothetical protein